MHSQVFITFLSDVHPGNLGTVNDGHVQDALLCSALFGIAGFVEVRDPR